MHGLRRIAPVVSCSHGSWLGEKEKESKGLQQLEESATEANDAAILTTAGWYSKYERAEILESRKHLRCQLSINTQRIQALVSAK